MHVQCVYDMNDKTMNDVTQVTEQHASDTHLKCVALSATAEERTKTRCDNLNVCTCTCTYKICNTHVAHT